MFVTESNPSYPQGYDSASGKINYKLSKTFRSRGFDSSYTSEDFDLPDGSLIITLASVLFPILHTKIPPNKWGDFLLLRSYFINNVEDHRDHEKGNSHEKQERISARAVFSLALLIFVKVLVIIYRSD